MSELLSILVLDVPEEQAPEDGFLEVIRQSHNENINSNIYAYFLSSTINQEISFLFLDSLLTIIDDKISMKLRFEDFTVNTEIVTKNKKRIDICIEDTVNEAAIIIENKIYHKLHNDLKDYWNHIKFKDKIGVLLTLSKTKIPNNVKNEFINITHKEWIDEIRSRGIPNSLSLKNYVYINDFFQTIDNLSKSKKMNDSAKFYFQHTNKIKKIIDTSEEAYKFVSDQIEISASMLDLKTYGQTRKWRHIKDAGTYSECYYVIYFEELLNGSQRISIIIELTGKIKTKAEDLKNSLKESKDYHNFEKSSKLSYLHFFHKSYDLSIKDLESLAHFINLKIKSDFSSIMSKIITFNSNKDNFSTTNQEN